MKIKLRKLIDPSGKMFRDVYVKKHYPEIHEEIIKFIEEYNLQELPFKQQVYHYLNDLKYIVKCKNPKCNNKVKFRNSTIGYLEYCCNRCIGTDPKIIKQKENKSIEKFGTKTPSESEEIKQKMIKTNQERYGHNCPLQNEKVNKKSKDTLMKNYGVENPLQSNIIIDKIKKTNLKKYGVENVKSVPEIQEKIKNTMIDRYGFEYALQNEELLNKLKNTNLKKYGVEYPCQNEIIMDKMKQTNLKRYGTECTFENEEINEKSKITINEKYGVDNVFSSEEIKEKIKNVLIKKYGVEHPLQNKEIHDKVGKTNLERYGVKNVFQNDEIKEKIKQTNLKRYGVESPMQNEEIFLKAQKTAFTTKLHECGLYYQGSYEKDFLNKYANKVKIERGKTIIYNDNNKYYCDYYLPEYNLLVEIKSDYLYKKFEQMNIDKHEECLKQGYKHIFIINKDYSEFERLFMTI